MFIRNIFFADQIEANRNWAELKGMNKEELPG